MKVLITIINPKEKVRRQLIKEKEERRNEDGLTKRQQQKQDTIKAVTELYIKGYKQVEIVKELNLTKGRVSQIVKALNKV